MESKRISFKKLFQQTTITKIPSKIVSTDGSTSTAKKIFENQRSVVKMSVNKNKEVEEKSVTTATVHVLNEAQCKKLQKISSSILGVKQKNIQIKMVQNIHQSKNTQNLIQNNKVQSQSSQSSSKQSSLNSDDKQIVKQAQKQGIKQQTPKQQTKQKMVVKSRSKIFKQQLINSIPNQIKTSSHRWEYSEGITPKRLVFLNWNVNGMRSVMSKSSFKPYINTLKPDIFCVSETKIDESSFDQSPIRLEGYHGYWNFSKHSKGYSGVAVFSKYRPKASCQDLSQRQHSQQGRILTLQYQKFILINLYAPTSGKELQRLKYREKFDTAFKNHVSKIKAEHPNKVILITGDLNVSHTEIDYHPCRQIPKLMASSTFTQKRGFTELLHLGMTDVYRYLHPDTRAYTWWYVQIGMRDDLSKPGIGKRLDYFVITSEHIKLVKRCDIMRMVMGADHCPVQMEIQFQD